MRIGDVIGTVTLNRCHPSLVGARFKLVAPLSWDNLRPLRRAAGGDCRIRRIGRGRGQPHRHQRRPRGRHALHPEIKPIDAYNAAILDTTRQSVMIAEQH